MAQGDQDKGKPPRPARRRKCKGYRAHQGRIGANFDATGRIEVYSSKSGSAHVYIAKSAKGLVKVGFSMSLKTRIFFLHSAVRRCHRPVTLVRAIKINRDLAYKIERYTQHLLKPSSAKMTYPGLGPSKEWFRCDAPVAEAALEVAMDRIVAFRRKTGHARFYWREAIPL